MAAGCCVAAFHDRSSPGRSKRRRVLNSAAIRPLSGSSYQTNQALLSREDVRVISEDALLSTPTSLALFAILFYRFSYVVATRVPRSNLYLWLLFAVAMT